MDNKIVGAVSQIASEHGFQCWVIAAADGSVIARGGDFEGLIWPTLVKDLFGGPDEVKVLFDYLEGKMLPQLSSQGEVFCVLMKPTKDIVIGAFAQDGRDAISLYREGKEVSKALEELLNPEFGNPQT